MVLLSLMVDEKNSFNNFLSVFSGFFVSKAAKVIESLGLS
jgi:hypothetical protein